MGLGFPGGSKIARLSSEFEISATEAQKKEANELFPRGLMHDGTLDFSFSGMKSAIKRYIDALGTLTESDREGIAYATESAIT